MSPSNNTSSFNVRLTKTPDYVIMNYTVYGQFLAGNGLKEDVFSVAKAFRGIKDNLVEEVSYYFFMLP